MRPGTKIRLSLDPAAGTDIGEAAQDALDFRSAVGTEVLLLFNGCALRIYGAETVADIERDYERLLNERRGQAQ